MTDFEPYVADPAEPAEQPRLGRFRGVTAILAIVVGIAAILILTLAPQSQDPSLDVPLDQFVPQDPPSPPG